MATIVATLKIAQIQISILRGFYDAGERHFTFDLKRTDVDRGVHRYREIVTAEPAPPAGW